MKTFANRLVILAASAFALGTMAYGQTMKAEIPFAFRTVNASLPAGSYQLTDVKNGGSATTIRLWNTDSHRGVFVMSAPADIYHTGNATVVFACGSQGCSLSQIRTAKGTLAYAAPHKAGRDNEAVSMVAIPLTRNAD